MMGLECQVIFQEADEQVVSNNDEGQTPEAWNNTIISECYSMMERSLH